MAATYKDVVRFILSPFAHSLSEGPEGVDYMHRNRVMRVRQDIADNAAGDTWTRYITIADKAVTITAITITTDAAVALHATNFATLSFATGVIGTMVSQDSMSTEAVAFVAGTPRSFTVVPSTDSLAITNQLSYSKAVDAAGVAMPGHLLEIHYQYA